MAPSTIKEYQEALLKLGVEIPSGKMRLAEYKEMYESANASPPPASPASELRRRPTAKPLEAEAEPPPPVKPTSTSADTGIIKEVIALALERTPWLLIFLAGLLLSSSLMQAFEGILEKEIELVYFTGMLVGHGGNSGGQVVSNVIRALGSKEVKLSDASRVITKEAAAGLLQSLVLVAFLVPCLFVMGISQKVSAVVAVTVPLLGVLANALGAALPFAVTYVGLDPAVIVGPLMTTCIDTAGTVMYLAIATFVLS